MIKKTLTLLIFIFTVNNVFSQGLPFSMTVNTGINVSDMDIQHLNTNPKIGFAENIGLEYNLSKKLFLQTSFGYTSKGAKVDHTEKGSFNNDYIYFKLVKGKYNTHYLTIPLMAGYRLSVSDKIRMNLSLGPYFSYGIAGKFRIEQALMEMISSTEDGAQHQFDYSGSSGKSFDALNRFDMGLKGNVGIEYYRCLINIGYEYGFINQYKEGSDLSSYNMNLFVGLGFRIF
ncbi:PorT family protein [Dysgonomonas sp. Marseille-P4677]|uniref:porin family protein n=1 Tax=Dysgonomonas sp. Marseille-P4677 TaxID=2364790 RepID=UPI001913F372|nr:porin family protein [Dysgonomonas sp. Marseille-P4677]MBK5720550.1 PorT family protein [Dysgonomonas sp. Marseille-P4677]